jgi:hypothetical protein
MHRIDDPNAIPELPALGAEGTPGYFDEGDPLTGKPATGVSADWLNAVQESLALTIETAEMELVKGNNDLLRQAVRWHAADALAPYLNSLKAIIVAAGLTHDPASTTQLRQAILLDTHKVGDVVIRADDTSPATLYGGTWVNYAAGRVLVGLDANDTDFDAVGKTGGAKTHTLTTAQLPAHDHRNSDHFYLLRPPYSGSLTGNDANGSGSEQAVGAGDGAEIATVGANQPHNNLQPYVVVRFWKRTA